MAPHTIGCVSAGLLPSADRNAASKSALQTEPPLSRYPTLWIPTIPDCPEKFCAYLGIPGRTPAGLRLHPGIIASVIFVVVAAVAAAALIIRKYCFPVNETAYRYSLLRGMEEQQSAVTEEDGDRGLFTGGEESDEDLLE
ncbi:hypothetical protein FQA47_007529 [Oryzias melastigma]|uniref:Uncharacterized protein n=1 Tax=Oryzias melastigma TaxID=30732 RepID=A0A834CG83_ORYME|nr:hypothetical protein FQA47_007529 [Oryzias melastigma]